MDSSRQHKKLQLNSDLGFLNQLDRFDILIPFIHLEKYLMMELERRNIKVYYQHSRLLITAPVNERPIWAQDWWPSCQILSDFSEAIDFLKSQKNLGIYYQTESDNLSKRIQNRIKNIPLKRIDYKVPHPFNFKFYTYTTIQDQVLFCAQPFQRFPFGWHEFNEDKQTPPNRAYLKLWELLSVYNIVPSSGSKIIEIGASPGGWSWVLSQFAAEVHTFDRAPLDPKLNPIKNIHHHIGDAFKIPFEQYQQCDWFFSDLICTPEKLYETINLWMKHSRIQNYVCTIKFKGDCDFDIMNQFLQIPGSRIIHLYQNKNEVTWIRTAE